VRHGRKQTLRSRFLQDKGQRGELEAFAAAVRGRGESPIPFDEIVSTTLATFGTAASRSSNQAAQVDTAGFMRSNTQSSLAAS
jgi:hypothetical protein